MHNGHISSQSPRITHSYPQLCNNRATASISVRASISFAAHGVRSGCGHQKLHAAIKKWIQCQLSQRRQRQSQSKPIFTKY